MYWKVYSTIATITLTIANKINDYCFNKVQKHYARQEEKAKEKYYNQMEKYY